jgi:hypothetical protein
VRSVCVPWVAAFVLATPVSPARAQTSQPSGVEQTTLSAAHGQLITPQMGLDEALQAFESGYRDSSNGISHRLDREGSKNLIKDLSVLNAKLSAASKYPQNIILSPYIHPAPLPPAKLQRLRHMLPSGLKPPEVSYQTFAVTLNGKTYVIAPGHGTRGDKRFYTPPKSDTAVRLATQEEAGYAIPLDRIPQDSFTKIVTLEGKFQTGEIVRVQCAAVRGSEVLQTLLPDLRASFHDWNHNVEVDYERTLIFVLPPQWLYAGRLKIRRVAGFSGAPAIEKTSGGDVVAGHFIGHDTVDIDGRKMTLGVVEDYRAIRAAVESFAALPRMELSRTKD